MDNKEWLKKRIRRVEHEMKNEPDKRKKERLNKYKQQLEIDLRDYSFFKNGGKIGKS